MSQNSLRLSHYDPRWPQDFEQERSQLLWATEGRITQIVHVGGTSIPGAIARPVIDMLAAVADLKELADTTLLIEGIYYRANDHCQAESCAPGTCEQFEGCTGEAAGAAIELTKPRHGETTHRVWLTTEDSALWIRAVRTRDWLRTHPQELQRYNQLKSRFFLESDNAPGYYQQRKALYYESLYEQIAAELRT